MRPLRPDTDHRLGRPLPCQLTNLPRTPLQAQLLALTRKCYAVLAKVSLSYSPLGGRSFTCYSPVRHCTQARKPFLVRLACVRHAASVDSEPGSNSHLILVCFCLQGQGSEGSKPSGRSKSKPEIHLCCENRNLKKSRPLTNWHVQPCCQRSRKLFSPRRRALDQEHSPP